MAGAAPYVVKTGQAAPIGAAGLRYNAAQAAAKGPWVAPPVPAGSYNPIRDNELAEGKLSTEQGITGDERQRTNAENTYATNLQLLNEREASQKQTGQETLARLTESYKKLGAQQGEQANAKGTLYGGALIAAAQKRAANEDVTKASDERSLAETLKGDENDRGQLSVAEGQLLGPGGSLVEAIQNARQAEQQREEGLGTLRSVEAAQNGYVAPHAPTAPLTLPKIIAQKAQRKIR